MKVKDMETRLQYKSWG